jgi:hypothetical protein
LSRVTFAQVVVRRPWPAAVQALGLSEDPVLLGSTAGPDARLQVSVQQQYQLVEADDAERGPWKVATRAYSYQLADSQGQEVAAWHWHPSGASPWRQPHLHVTGGRLGECHLPTGRVSLEGVLRLLLTELAVRPLRDDWLAVLDEAEAAFREWRTWS